MRDRLPFAERKRSVLVRELRELRREEGLARDCPEGGEDLLVDDPSPGEVRP